MQRQSVDSSTIKSVGYDVTQSILEIEFNNGVYQYADVPIGIYTNMMASDSVGKFFHANIKNVYTGVKV